MGWLNTAAPTPQIQDPGERKTLASASPDFFSALFEAGDRLLAAQTAEERRSKNLPKDITEAGTYLEELAALRLLVDERAREYCDLLAEFGFPGVSVEYVTKRGTDLRAFTAAKPVMAC